MKLSKSGVRDEDVLSMILPRMIWHDYRGWPQEDTWWLRGYYVSNKYLWIVDVEKYYNANVHAFDFRITITKYDFDILIDLTDPLVLKRLVRIDISDERLKKMVLESLPS